MRYLLLIYGDESAYATATPEDMQNETRRIWRLHRGHHR